MSGANKSPDSDEDLRSPNPAPPAAIRIGRDYDIIEDEAVLSSSPSYKSIPRTGQVIPIPGSDQMAEGNIGKASTSSGGSDSGVLVGSRREVHGNPFANLPRTSSSGGDASPPIPSSVSQADDDDALYAIDDGPEGRIKDNDAEEANRSGHDHQQQRQQNEEIKHYDEEPLTNSSALPRVNCPEKIIICLDLSSEVSRVPFVSRDFTKYNPLDLIKRALNICIRTKNTMNPLHEYALVILQDSAVWMQDFTSDVDEFVNVLLDLTDDTRDAEHFDLTSLFNVIQSKVDLPFVDDVSVLPPPYIVRTIFVYGRSNCVPEFLEGREAQKLLSSSPYFFFDVFYVHEPPSEDNLCKEVYDVFLELDTNNTSYIHEVGRNTTHLHNKMAMLLGHPLQRPIQMQASHSLVEEEA